VHPSPVTGDLDLSRPEFWALPRPERHAAFARLRAMPPAYFNADPSPFGTAEDGYYALVRHADVTEASRRPGVFSSAAGATSMWNLPAEYNEFFGSIISMDDPRHARLRRIVSRGFTPKMTETLREDIRRAAASVVDGLLNKGPCDFVEQVSAPFPLKIICGMMGIGDSDYATVLRNTNVILSGFDPEYVSGNITEAAGQILAAGNELGELAARLAAERQARPAGDLVSALVSGGNSGEQLTPAELASFFILLAVAGNDTVRNTVSHALILLTDHPGQRDLLLGDLDARIGPAVEEVIRYATPVIWMRRTLTRDAVVNGNSYAEGDKVLLFYQSANRDESVFIEPDRFDITRSPNPHTGFGAAGPHFCLGAPLARLEVTVLLRELLTRAPRIRAAAPPDYLRSNFSNGVKHLRCNPG
jgi:cytochrome P450